MVQALYVVAMIPDGNLVSASLHEDDLCATHADDVLQLWNDWESLYIYMNIALSVWMLLGVD